jgi:predicted permease
VPSYLQLFLLILPVFVIVAIGIVLRRLHWVEGQAEASLIKLVVNVCFPALIFQTVLGNPVFRDTGNVIWPPLLGFGFTSMGIVFSLLAGRLLGLTVGTGLRTFALTAGVANFGYLPLPIMAGLWGEQSWGVLLVHNVGVDAAFWSVGVLVLSGLSPLEGWRKVVNPPVISIIVTLALNFLGLADAVPEALMAVARLLGACAIPLGLIMIGVTMAEYLNEPGGLVSVRVTGGACLVRLLALPVIMLSIARVLPISVEMKRMLVIQAAMPSAVFPIVLSRLYGGHPRTAVQIVLGTTAVGLVAIPFWIRLGLSWLGG